MVGWSGRRRTLTILLFIMPTVLGILAFSVYPILFNTYISFTNRNQFHPNPDCSEAFNGILEPTCWGIFSRPPTSSLATPFHILDPIFANYLDLAGKLFTPDGLLALARLLVCLVPLIIASRINTTLDRRMTRSISSGMVWLVTIIATLLLAWLVDLPGAYNGVARTGDFLAVMTLTILYVAICIPLFFGLGLVLALILNSPYIKARAFFRVALIVPWAASTMAIMMSLVWQFFFREQGTINQILATQSIQGPIFLNNPVWAFFIIVLVNLWYTYPFFMVTILGALQSIPLEQYEAAEIDGASWWAQLSRITLPLLRPAILPIIVLSSITTFQMFDTVWAITQGGPTRGAALPGATELVMVFGYKQVFQAQAYGRIGALAVIIFVLLFLATLYSLRVTRITKGAYE
ncbi:MAG: sugar ABC transporter permease [Chloroflexota bacterium]|nr:sugar ABC transporter permease [Chloroflexota bacterium]